MKIKLPRNEVFNELIKEYPEYFSFSSGRFLRFSKWDESGFAIYSKGEDIAINYNTTSDMFRALGILMLNLSKKGEIKIRRIPPFKFRGLMIDSSRNAVIKEEYLKKIIIKLSLLGINYLTLYTEDTYEVENHPLIGYQRGKYTKDELRRISQFAKGFGIEMFPCIQTLGHVEQILKFPYYFDIRDDERIFSVKSEKTYELIETLLKNASEPYESKLIHIGMDETWGLGRGRCFEINKKIDPRAMYIKHLNKVNNICRKLKLSPIMWGDIVMGMSGTKEMTEKQKALLPKNVIMDYWDYYKEDEKFYENGIKAYRKMGYEPLISPGVWNWSRLWGLYGKVERTMVLFMKVAKKLKVNRAMLTMWGDDGNEAPFDSNWPALVLYAEHCYENNVDMTLVKKMVNVITKDEWNSFVLPSKMDYLNDKSISSASNMSRCFLYDDPLLGIYASHALGKKMNPFYEDLYKKMKLVIKNVDKSNKLLFQYAYAILDCLRFKADIRNESYLAYRSGKKEKLKDILKDISIVLKKVDILWKTHRKLWLYERKPFGLEVLDLRYSGLIGRLKVMKERISDYLSGKIKDIPELEEKPQKIYGKFPYIHLHYKKIDSITVVK